MTFFFMVIIIYRPEQQLPAPAELPILPAAASSTDTSELLRPHGQQWCCDGEIIQDATSSYRSRSKLLWQNNDLTQTRTEFDYFALFFPCQIIADIVRLTNLELGRRLKDATLTAAEFWKYLGIRLAMNQSGSHLSIAEYWKVTLDEGAWGHPPDFGSTFNMSRHRFEDITSCLRLDTFDIGVLDQVTDIFRLITLLLLTLVYAPCRIHGCLLGALLTPSIVDVKQCFDQARR
jgi:hypothetical protein